MAIQDTQIKTGMALLKETIALFNARRGEWLLLAMTYLAIFILIPSFPGLSFLGMFSIAVWPALTVFILMMFRNADMGKSETGQQVWAHIKPRFRELLTLGLACLTYVVLISYLFNADLTEIVAMTQNGEEMSDDEKRLLMQKLMPLMMQLMVLLLPLFVITWFSPMLIAINQYPVLKAVKSSIAGILQYTLAMGVTWLMLNLLLMVFVMAAGLLLGILAGLIPAFSILIPIVLFASILIGTALMFAFQYITYRDVFQAAPVIPS